MDKVFAVMMVKDEEDIVGYTIKHLIAEDVDGMVIYDNGSTDGTAGIIADIQRNSPIPISLRKDEEPAYYQSEKTTEMALAAKKMGADIILPVDADELPYSWDGNKVASVLRRELASGSGPVVGMPWWFHFPTTSDICSPNPFKAMVYRQAAANQLFKIAVRFDEHMVIEQGNHNVRWDGGKVIPGIGTSLNVRHFPYRGVDQFVRKIVNGGQAYAAGGDKIPAIFGTAWRQYYQAYLDFGRPGLEKIFHENYFYGDPGTLIYDPAPYREEIKL